jgi:acetylornithine deacetylase/succinyl-diaminopimelate desuccinylase-like protein
VRGVVTVDLTIYGPNRELHSGHYGNWAPNPALLLARLLASMKDDDGRVLINGWYDGAEPLGKSEREAIAAEPEIDAALRRELGLARSDGGRKLLELITLPSLNVRGLTSAATGTLARNVIPATATAAFDIRLVKGIEPAMAVARFTAHVRKQGYHVVDGEPDMQTRLAHARVAKIAARHGGYNAVRTPMDLPIARDIVAAVEKARGAVIKIPNMGGSVPLAVIEETLGAPTIGVPIANHDNNQHSADENLRVQNLWDGVAVMKALLSMK